MRLLAFCDGIVAPRLGDFATAAPNSFTLKYLRPGAPHSAEPKAELMWGSSRLHADSYHRATNISKCHPEDEGAKRVRRIYALRLFPPRSVSTHRFAIEKRHGARSANGRGVEPPFVPSSAFRLAQ